MIHRDWFRRMLEVLTQALGAVLGLKKRGEVQEALAAIEGAVRKAFGMDPGLALALPIEDFLKLACRGDDPSSELLATLAEAFREWALLLEAQGRTREAAAASRRAEELSRLPGGGL